MKSLRDLRLLLVLIVGFFGIWLLVGSDNDDETPDPRVSSYNHTYRGCKAWLLTLDELGIRTTQLTRAFPAGLDGAGTVVIVDPVEPVRARQVRAVLDWVRRGGRLFFVEAYPEPSALGAGLHLRVRNSLAGDGPVPGDAATPVGRAGGLYAGPLRFASVPGGARRIAGDARGPLLVEWSLGRGRVVALADPGPVTNELLDRLGNARLAVDAARKEPVVFDEYHQGYSADPAEPTFWRQLGRPLRLALYQLAFAVLLMAWTASRRFGLATVPPFGPRRTAGEYVVSLGALLQRARAEGTALEVIGERFRRDLAASGGAPADLPDDLLVDAAAARADLPRERIERALAASHGRLPHGMKRLDACRLIAQVREELNLHVRVP